MEEHRRVTQPHGIIKGRYLTSLQQNGQPLNKRVKYLCTVWSIDSFCAPKCVFFVFFFPDTVAMQASLQIPPSYTLS